MTDAILQGLALQALNMAKVDVQRNQFICLMAVYHEGSPLYRMKRIEARFVETFGQNWLNDGRKKDAVFDGLRFCVDAGKPDAVVFVTPSNMFKPTSKLEKLPPEQQKAIINQGHDGHHQAVRQGLFTIHDVLCAVAQNDKRVCLYNQSVRSSGLFYGQPQVDFFDQADFDGRLKMYGKEQ